MVAAGLGFAALVQASHKFVSGMLTVVPWFRSCKSPLHTRPIYHRQDATIRGHVFCSFLALVLRHELQSRMQTRGEEAEWAEVLQDLERLQYVDVEQTGKRFRLRSELQGTPPAKEGEGRWEILNVPLPFPLPKSNESRR